VAPAPIAGGSAASVCAVITCPPQVNIQTIVPTGAADYSAVFQAAVNAGDVLVTAGTYPINNASILMARSNKHLRCAPGAILTNTNRGIHTGSYTGMFVLQSASPVSNVSIIGCDFRQSNSEPPVFNEDGHFNVAINGQDGVSNVLIAGNFFRNAPGQAAVQNYCPATGCAGWVITYNTFSGCGLYGAALTASRNGKITYNKATDCELGVEVDVPGQPTGGNEIAYNTLDAKYGIHSPTDTDKATLLTGGSSSQAIDYSGNTVHHNTVKGLPGKVAALIQGSMMPPQYSNNLCTAGTNCVCVTGPSNGSLCSATGPGSGGVGGVP
jgi:hypothetical protein